MLYIASDHAGWELKEKIKSYLDKKNIKYQDLSNISFDEKDDYPVFAQKLSKLVVKNKAKGILICDTGIGMSIVANKHKGVRAALAFNEWMAERSRQHNDANILVLGAQLYGVRKAIRMIEVFLKTKFSKVSRHKKRLAMFK